MITHFFLIYFILKGGISAGISKQVPEKDMSAGKAVEIDSSTEHVEEQGPLNQKRLRKSVIFSNESPETSKLNNLELQRLVLLEKSELIKIKTAFLKSKIEKQGFY